MTDSWLKRLIQAAIESFPIDAERKQAILKKIKGRETDEEE